MQQNGINTQLNLSKKYLLAIRYNTPEISCKVLLGEARKHLALACDLANKYEQWKIAQIYKAINKNCTGKEVMTAKKNAINGINEMLSIKVVQRA